MTVTNYIWDELSDNVRMEVDDTGTVIAEYMSEPGQFGNLISQRRSGTNSFYHFDAQGSTRQLTNDSQSVTDIYTYSAFGELVSSTGTTTNPFRYCGSVGYYTNSETGDVYVRRRTYQPDKGRWMTLDPLLFDDSLNLYQYVSNQVVFAIDPSGLMQSETTRMCPVDQCVAECKKLHSSRRADRSGRFPGNNRTSPRHDCIETCYDYRRKLLKWYDNELDTDWLTKLEPCPCHVPLYCHSSPHGGCGGTLAPWESDIAIDIPLIPLVGYGIWSFHPGAHWCVRTIGSFPKQQCCYDSHGELITFGVGAGTPDKGTPDHQSGDVDPFIWAKRLCCLSMYWKRRPPNQGEDCDGDQCPPNGTHKVEGCITERPPGLERAVLPI